jgi:hypothetical protein
MNTIGGHHVKWSKPGSDRQRILVFSHMWEVDTIQATLWKTGYTKGRSLTREGGQKKEVKKVNMGDVLSIQEWV